MHEIQQTYRLSPDGDRKFVLSVTGCPYEIRAVQLAAQRAVDKLRAKNGKPKKPCGCEEK